MNERDRELDFYRRQADATGARVLQLAEEVAVARRETRRVRAVARLLRDAYSLTEVGVEPADIGQRFLDVLIDALSTDRAVIFRYVSQERSFTVQAAIGLPDPDSAAFSMAGLGCKEPEEFCYQRSGQEPDPMERLIAEALGVPYYLWAFDRDTGLALLVGSEVEDARLHTPFEAADREIIRGALDVLAEVHHLADAREALRQSEENFRITLNSIGDAVISTDRDTRITGMNPVAEALTGWPKREAAGRGLEEVFVTVNARTRELVENPVDRVLRDGKVAGLAGHTVLLTRDGQERQIADSGAPIRNDAGEILGVVLVFRDVTEECELQDRLRQSQKMETIGQLAGGIAHDFNNLLVPLIGYAELLQDDLHEPHHLEQVHAIIKSAQIAAGLTKQLLAFARKGKVQQIPVNVHTICDEVGGLLQHLVDRRIALRSDLQASRPVLVGDPAQIKNMILNVALNARDAMPDGGSLTISTRETVLDERYCEGKDCQLAAGPYIDIAVSDTGIGMTPETLKRIFEPFFTTKDPGKGTGMGLSSVYGTARNHHGDVTVDSKPGAGSVFHAFLPVAQGNEHWVDALPHDKAPSANLRILLVDDEPEVLALGAKLLERAGHEVIMAPDGPAAIAVYQESWRIIDLVLLDVIMPGMHGRNVFRRLREINPNARILICTGYGNDEEMHALLDVGAVGILQKPFCRAHLLVAIQRARVPASQTP